MPADNTSQEKPKPSDAPSKAKEECVQFHASKRFLEVLDELKESHGLSRSEAIRKAVTLLLIVSRQRAEGNDFAVVDSQNKVIGRLAVF